MTDTLSKEERSRVMAKSQIPRHKAGKESAVAAFFAGISFPPVPKESTRKTGHRVEKIQNRHFRSWLFLARARKLQKRPHSQKQCRILEKQNRTQQTTFCRSFPTASRARLESRCHLGMRNEGYDNTKKVFIRKHFT